MNKMPILEKIGIKCLNHSQIEKCYQNLILQFVYMNVLYSLRYNWKKPTESECIKIKIKWTKPLTI